MSNSQDRNEGQQERENVQQQVEERLPAPMQQRTPAPAPTFESLRPAMSLEEAGEQLKLVQNFVSKMLVEGEDYWKELDGRKLRKPCLGKSGGEKLVNYFALAPTYYSLPEPAWVRDLREEGKQVIWRGLVCRLTHIPTGAFVGEGMGVCHSEEPQYKYRWYYEDSLSEAQRKEAEKEDYPRRRRGKSYQVRFENPDIYAEDNKITKIGKKRAFVDATLTATRASHKFTQDLEDMPTGSEGGDYNAEDAEYFQFVPFFVLANALGVETDLDVSEEVLRGMLEDEFTTELRKSKKGKNLWWIELPGDIATAVQEDREKRTEEQCKTLAEFADPFLGQEQIDETAPAEEEWVPPEDPEPYDGEDSYEPAEQQDAEVEEDHAPERHSNRSSKDDSPNRGNTDRATAKQMQFIYYGGGDKLSLFDRVLKRLSVSRKKENKHAVFMYFCAYRFTLDRSVYVNVDGEDWDITRDEAQALIDLLNRPSQDVAEEVEKLIMESAEDAVV